LELGHPWFNSNQQRVFFSQDFKLKITDEIDNLVIRGSEELVTICTILDGLPNYDASETHSYELCLENLTDTYANIDKYNS
jgi:hypothetical protein